MYQAQRATSVTRAPCWRITSPRILESNHQALTEIHLAESNRNEAIRQFNRYRDLVRDGLSLDTSPSITRLFAGLVVS